MSSTYSPILRTELIGAGEKAGTWGSTTNDNFQYVFEAAIAGYQAVTVSPTSNNQVLTYVNGPSAVGSLDQSIFALLKLNAGTVTANFNIFAPPVSKPFTVWNNTAYTATFYNSSVIGNTTAAGTGITIPAGMKTSIWSDGTNFYTTNSGIVGSFTVNGNLSVTGTTTLTGATTLSSALTYGGVTLSNAVTGTGNMVLSASPTFTGSPIAPTQTAGDNSTKIATTAYVATAVTGGLATLGTMATQNANNVAITGGTINGTTIGATTAASVRGTTGTFTGALSAASASFTGALSTTGALSAASASFTAALPVLSGGTGVTTSTGTGSTVLSASPTFTGTPVAPTATAGTNTTQIATTAFVSTAVTNATGSLGTMSTQNANAVAITGGTIGSAVTATTQTLGTNNTTLATTAFVQAAVGTYFPSGTRLTFAQAAAPTGWTQDVTDTANNRMLRVVSSTGGGTGGSASPILMDVVPTHSHTASSGLQSANHTHAVSGYTGGQTADHTHSSQGNGAPNGGGSGIAYTIGGNVPGYATTGTSNDHAHYFSATSGGVNANHNHAITVGNNSGSNWTPRYVDLIICAKN